MFIDGEWVGSSNGRTTDVLDPSTAQVIEQIPEASRSDLGQAIDAARRAFTKGPWSKTTPAERSNLLLKLADLLEQKAEEFAKLESANSGKSIKQTTTYDMPYTIDNIRFLAGASRVLEGKSMGEYVPEGTSAIRREPIGVIACITPWNYPLMMAAWRALPALSTGNTVIVKSASYTPLSTFQLARLMEQVGFPKGVFNVVTGRGSEVGEQLVSSPSVDMIAFTGSTEVGRRLSELGASTVKKISLELGGKAPFIVFGDADIESTAQGAVVGGMVNNGQDCANSTRYYVQESVISEFQELLIRKLSAVRVGNRMQMTTDMGLSYLKLKEKESRST